MALKSIQLSLLVSAFRKSVSPLRRHVHQRSRRPISQPVWSHKSLKAQQIKLRASLMAASRTPKPLIFPIWLSSRIYLILIYYVADNNQLSILSSVIHHGHPANLDISNERHRVLYGSKYTDALANQSYF